MSNKPKTVSEYISSKPKEARDRLSELSEYLWIADPEAKQELKWGKPAFVDDGILYVFSGSKSHVSLHPTPSVIDHFRKELSGFTVSANTIQFPLDKPIPKSIVLKLAKFRVKEKKLKGIGWK